MTHDPRQLRDAFGAFLTGVTVVTTFNAEGQPIGFTANSFTSVSLDPPLLLVCLAKTSRNYAAVTEAAGFAVNILSEAQKDVSNTFARPVEDRFAAVDWQRGPFGSPVFSSVAAWFDCATHSVIDAGDHAILIGRVEAFENSGLTGLGYARGGYFLPALADKVLISGQDMPQVLGAVAERDGAVLLTETADGGLALPALELGAGDGVDALAAHLVSLSGLPVQPGLVYSIYEDTRARRQHVIYRATLGDGAATGGVFFPVEALPLERIADGATRDVLKRYAAEQSLGNFGVYVGNQERGRVHAQPVRS
ncbi:NADH-FMN oxidoreductase RutF, flavin reductase (DIM6/NTAB) family [Rhizobium sp. RU20A]|uniref:flavin reductase family protein n=1 Tax=Rhizobium sp. RU20A TaxID=1907412 RepID=UPI0009563A5C|nr:flavin reductase family protein [Rhizobium sp. RU20A]SIR29561.1 NADH-FMN oxidoreductase RutF, flavin reductase (DIM6/NTAB) family [Rhizobium sp. RU20A]